MSRRVSGTELKYLHSNVLVLLSIAEEHNGTLYGGYVRDVIPKVMVNDFSVTTVKDVDICFSTEKDRDSFIEDASDMLLLTDRNLTDRTISMVSSAGFNTIQYILVDDFGDRLIYVDLVVDPILPATDMSVNFLTYSCSTNKITSHGMYSLTDVLSDIRNKQARLTAGCYDIVQTTHSQGVTEFCGRQIHLAALKERLMKFIERGWQLLDPDGKKITFERGTSPSGGLVVTVLSEDSV